MGASFAGSRAPRPCPWNVPAAHALLVAALGADLARRAGYAALPWAKVLDSAAVLAGKHVEQSPAVWLFERL